MSVDMQTDVHAIVASPIWLPLSVMGLLFIKGSVMMLVLRLGRIPADRAFESGLLMGQGGEFALIVTSSGKKRTPDAVSRSPSRHA